MIFLLIIDTNKLIILLLPCDWLSITTMYDEEAGIEVFVRPYDSDTAYREYRAPRSSPLYTGQKNERYIEAVNDERFEVVVKLEPAFDFKMYTGVKVCTNIDGGGISCHTILANPKRKVESRIVLRECFSYEGHEWQCVGFCFREAKACMYRYSPSQIDELANFTQWRTAILLPKRKSMKHQRGAESKSVYNSGDGNGSIAS